MTWTIKEELNVPIAKDDIKVWACPTGYQIRYKGVVIDETQGQVWNRWGDFAWVKANEILDGKPIDIYIKDRVMKIVSGEITPTIILKEDISMIANTIGYEIKGTGS